MCVCVVIPFIPDVRPVDAPAGITQEEGHRISPPSSCGACFSFSRGKDSARPFPSSTMKSKAVDKYIQNTRTEKKHPKTQRDVWYYGTINNVVESHLLMLVGHGRAILLVHETVCFAALGRCRNVGVQDFSKPRLGANC